MNSSVLRSALMFCLKCAIFSVIFWSIWFYIIQPMNLAARSKVSTEQEAQAAQDATQTDTYEAYQKQMDRATRQLDMAEDQQRRMDQYLTVQQQHAKRLDAILTVWEKQTGLKP